MRTTDDGSFLRVNRVFAHWLGHDPRELVGRRFADLLTMGGRIFHQTHWLPLLRMQGSISEVKLDLVHHDGSTVTMVLNARRHETEAGRRLVLLTRVPDRPGALASLLACVADTGANLVDVSHRREGVYLHVRETAVELVLETRGHEHAERVLETLREAGYEARVLR